MEEQLFPISIELISNEDWKSWEDSLNKKMNNELKILSEDFNYKINEISKTVGKIKENKMEIEAKCKETNTDLGASLITSEYAYNKAYVLHSWHYIEYERKKNNIIILYQQLKEDFLKLKNQNNNLNSGNEKEKINVDNLEQELICKRKRRLGTGTEIKQKEIDSFLLSKCNLLIKSFESFDCFIQINFYKVAFAKTIKEMVINAYREKMIVNVRDQSEKERKFMLDLNSNNLEHDFNGDDGLTKYYLKLLIKGLDDGLDKKTTNKKIKVIVAGLRLTEIELLSDIENGKDSKIVLDNDQISLLYNYMRHINANYHVTFLKKSKSRFLDKLSAYISYNQNSFKGNYCTEVISYEGCECESDDEI
uniref:Uncharacterized protein n=1 Tax=Strongyloides papillosus TaxID=174720 RepID=A0A0N5BED4_STREA